MAETLANPDQPFPLQIGRQIEYVLANGAVRAAHISQVWDVQEGIVNCHVLIDPMTDPSVNVDDRFVTTTPVARKARYDAQNKAAGTWHWPNNTPPDIVPVGTRQHVNGPAPHAMAQPQRIPAEALPQAGRPVDPSQVDDGIQVSAAIESMPPGVQCILSVQDEKMDYFMRGAYPLAFAYMPASLNQFPGIAWLDAAVDLVRNWRRRQWVVLVHGSTAANRAATVDIAYHMKFCGWKRDEAISVIRAKRPSTNPNPFYLAGLAQYEQLLGTAKGIGPATVTGPGIVAQASPPQQLANVSMLPPGYGPPQEQQIPQAIRPLPGPVAPAPTIHDPRFATRQVPQTISPVQ